MPLNEVGGVVPEPPPTVPKQCLVSSRWLTDTDHFNEWMNEEDYQLIIVVSSVIVSITGWCSYTCGQGLLTD